MIFYKNWKPQNTKGILNSVRKILEFGDIRHLTKDAYEHIILHMGFIAHFSRDGFVDTYRNVALFAEKLLTSEYSNQLDYNTKEAKRYATDPHFAEQYGDAYCQSVVACNVGVVQLAQKHLARLQNESNQNQKQEELKQMQAIAKKYNYKVEKISQTEGYFNLIHPKEKNDDKRNKETNL